VALGLAYAFLSLASEKMAADALPRPSSPRFDLVRLDAAAMVFPLARHLRHKQTEAMVGLQGTLPAKVILHQIDRELEDDPYAWDMRRNREILLKRIELCRQTNAEHC
jgi:hypothetical protein